MRLIVKQHSAKHGILKKELDIFLSGGFITLRAGRGYYKKGRYKLIGKSDRFLVLIVDKKASEVYDLVSARVATEQEKSLYCEALRC